MRSYLQQRIHKIVGLKENPVNFSAPLGDKGLFGPESVVWVVHSDFSSMLVGGITALYLQMIHPNVLAGVWDHSEFRKDLAGRLKRTAQFVSAVSFGPTEDAKKMLRLIKQMHEPVHGVTQQGEPYRANDPELLLWVHATQCYGYLQAHQCYRPQPLTEQQIAQYLAEYQQVLVGLGGEPVQWASWNELVAYLESQQPKLCGGERVTEVYRILKTETRTGKNKSLVGGLFLRAALDLVPTWGQQYFDYRPSQVGIATRTQLVLKIAQVLRWASTESAAKKAYQRVSIDDAQKDTLFKS